MGKACKIMGKTDVNDFGGEVNDLRSAVENMDKIVINAQSHRLLDQILEENPELKAILLEATVEKEALAGVKSWVLDILKDRPMAMKFYEDENAGREQFELLEWNDYAAIRLLDYVAYAGEVFEDLNLKDEVAVSNPIKMLWLAANHGMGGAQLPFFEDALHLFRQLRGEARCQRPDKEQVERWMERWPSGLDPSMLAIREANKKRILKIIIARIERGEISSSRFSFEPDLSEEEKYARVCEWWNDYHFHLSFAVRSPDALNEMLDGSLDADTMHTLRSAADVGIPFFVNPYYLSLLNVSVPRFAVGTDLALRDYVFYSKELIEEFGHIIAWEKEDRVEPGKPNAAGWLLPTASNVHRRYPEVAILIPDTVGRACGGLCASCQRMYDFQNGHLNFNLDKLEPRESWPEKLEKLMDYFENDSQLRDILITGGDGLMSSDHSLKELLDAIYRMALRKKEANRARKEGEKYAEIVRVRIGTRLPVYIPQRITDELVEILADFKVAAEKIGIRQFVIQTHFESALEVTSESRLAVAKLISAGWMVTNQHVLTSASSRRGHRAKLRKSLNDIGVLSYYTFSVKGYTENRHNFATNARAVQEQIEEKSVGTIPEKYQEEILNLSISAESMVKNISTLRKSAGIPFLATDRNVLNLPGVGKSLTFRVIGITRYGRHVLQFSHDATRRHSPAIDQMGKVVIVESKPIRAFMIQLAEMGEDISEYESLWGYSLGATEKRSSLYDYPDQSEQITEKMTNLKLTGHAVA